MDGEQSQTDRFEINISTTANNFTESHPLPYSFEFRWFPEGYNPTNPAPDSGPFSPTDHRSHRERRE